MMITAGMNLYQWVYEQMLKATDPREPLFETAIFINWHEEGGRLPTVWRFDHAQRFPKWDQPYTYVVLPYEAR